MSSLSANLKLYLPFQNKFVTGLYLLQALWVTLLFADMQIRINMSEVIQSGQYPYTPIVPFFYSMFIFGIIASSVQYGILLKPVSGLLPHHATVRIKTITYYGAGASLLFLITFIILPGQPVDFKYIIYALLLSISGLPFYFGAVYLNFNLSNLLKSSLLLLFYFILIFLFIFLFISFLLMEHFRFSFSQFIFYFFMPLFISLIMFAALALRTLKDPDLNRKHSNVSIFQTFEDFTLGIFGKIEFTDDKNWESLPGKYLMKKLISSPYMGIIKPVMGMLYHVTEFLYYSNGQSLGNISLPVLFTLITLVQLLTGYSAEGFNISGSLHTILTSAPVFLMCLVSGIYFNQYDNNILLPVGRKNNFRSGYLAWLTKPVLLEGWIIPVFLLSWILKSFMPDLTIFGIGLKYRPVGVFPILLPLVLIPVYDIFIDIAKIKSFMLVLFIAGVFAGAYGAHLVFSYYTNAPAGNREYPLLLIALITVIISNAAFIIRLRQRWLKSDIR